jgi:F-box domain
MDSPSPFIFNLPNELLREIINFLPGHHLFWLETLDGNIKWAIQILVLMSVSRRFRMIALEAEFWTCRDFDFDSLFEWRRPLDPFEAARKWLVEMNRVKALTKNNRITSHLGRKTQWTFSASYLLDFAILEIPHFRETVREITLCMPEAVKSFGKLSLCPHTTKLALSEGVGSVDVGQIHLSCPFLEELVIGGSLTNYSGTLHDLSNLRSLVIHTRQAPGELPLDLIPLHSTSTLSHLELDGRISPEAKKALSTFPNLTHFEILPLTAEICDFIPELSSVKLTAFGCVWFSLKVPPLPKLMRMFCSESLSRLTTLKFHIIPYNLESTEAYKQYSHSILKTITLALPFLEEFYAQMYMEEDGCQMFRQWRSLKKLTLKLARAGEQVDCKALEKHMAHLTDCFRKVFEGVEEKPLILVSVEY